MEETNTETQPLTPVERAEKAVLDLKQENDRMETRANEQREKDALNALGGSTTSEPAPVEVPLTDVEYANKFMRGEVNPLEDDDIKL